jgi:arylsulfatase A-like enzyme
MCVALSAASAAQRPNILLILVDDVGREVLGCYGGVSYATPEIDRLAAGGARFEHAYAMPVCHPTRTTLLTGQYPFRLGHPPWGSFPREVEERALPNVLKRAGYATAVGGKWQLALLGNDLQQPHRIGFDEYALYGWHEGPWYYQPHIWQNGRRRCDVRERYGPDVICDFVIDFIGRHRSGPFFMFYSMSLCHAETNDLDRPAPLSPDGRYDSYAEMVGKMDERIGRVVRELDRLGLREQTLVLFLSDNGTAQKSLVGVEGDQLIYEPVVSRMADREVAGGKGTLSDWGTRVPLIAHWPGRVEPCVVGNHLVDVSDLLPTLAEIAGAPLPGDVVLDGRSFTGAWRGAARNRDWVFSEHRGRYFVRNLRFKLYGDGALFDLDNDPDERHALRRDALSAEATAALETLGRAIDALGCRERAEPPR